MTADLGSFLYIIKNRERRSRQTADHKRAATICQTAYQICTPLLPFPAAAFYRHVCWLETEYARHRTTATAVVGRLRFSLSYNLLRRRAVCFLRQI
ncbi:hypothetical protein AAC387_Pa01g2650 [Persea americana]